MSCPLIDSSAISSSSPHSYLLGKEFMPKVVDSLIQGMREKGTGAVFQPTSEGATGFTFICRIPNPFIKGEFPQTDLNSFDDSFSFISKWVSRGYAKSEQVFSRIFRDYAVSAPEIQLNVECLGNDHSKRLHQLAKLTKYAMGDSELYDLLFMNCFNGMTLKSFIQEGHLNRLSEIDLQIFFQKMGQGIILDLMIANDDRILSYDYSSPDFLNRISPRFNLGNIMVEYPPMKDRPSRFMKEVHFIDNNSSIALIDKKNINFSEVVELGGLFDDDSESQNSTIQKPSESQKEGLSSDDHAVKFVEAFKHLITHREILVSYIYQIFLDQEQALASSEDLIKSALHQGMEEMISTIKSHAFPDCEENSSSYLNRSIELIKKNIQFLKES
jgi:hypothetical protein